MKRKTIKLRQSGEQFGGRVLGGASTASDIRKIDADACCSATQPVMHVIENIGRVSRLRHRTWDVESRQISR